MGQAVSKPQLSLPGYHYCGTGTIMPSKERPINFWDSCCQEHDKAYYYGLKQLEYQYDEELIHCLGQKEPQTLQEALEVSFMLKTLDMKHVTKSSCF